MKSRIKKTVYEVLKQNKTARANDNELIYQCLKKMNMPTDYVWLRTMNTNIASTITRERNRAVKNNPGLNPAKQVVKRRMALERKAREEYGKQF